MKRSSLLKYRQTIFMGISLILFIGFFLPWVTMDPNFSMFATSKASFSGLSMIIGIKFAVEMIGAFGTAYNFPLSANVVYLGYLILLIPLLGIISIIMSGLRSPIAEKIHLSQYIFSFVIFISFAVISNISKDMRELVNNVTNTGFGYYICLIASIAGIAFFIYQKKMLKKHF